MPPRRNQSSFKLRRDRLFPGETKQNTEHGWKCRTQRSDSHHKDSRTDPTRETMMMMMMISARAATIFMEAGGRGRGTEGGCSNTSVSAGDRRARIPNKRSRRRREICSDSRRWDGSMDHGLLWGLLRILVRPQTWAREQCSNFFTPRCCAFVRRVARWT